MLILRGLSYFCLVSSGRCPEHLVEVEGLVPNAPYISVSNYYKS